MPTSIAPASHRHQGVWNPFPHSVVGRILVVVQINPNYESAVTEPVGLAVEGSRRRTVANTTVCEIERIISATMGEVSSR